MRRKIECLYCGSPFVQKRKREKYLKRVSPLLDLKLLKVGKEEEEVVKISGNEIFVCEQCGRTYEIINKNRTIEQFFNLVLKELIVNNKKEEIIVQKMYRYKIPLKKIFKGLMKPFAITLVKYDSVINKIRKTFGADVVEVDLFFRRKRGERFFLMLTYNKRKNIYLLDDLVVI